MSSELSFSRDRIRALLDTLERLAAGDTHVNLELSSAHDELDAIAFGINVLADELRWAYTRITESERVKADALRAELAHLGRVRMIDPLSGSFAHEINQPLTAVMANAEAALRLLEARPTPVLALRETLGEILLDNKRAADVMQRMRTLLKKGTTLSESVDVNGVVTDVEKLVQGNAALRRVQLDVQLAADLGSVLGDRIQIQQVVLNLLLNAFDAVEDREIARRRVRLRTTRCGLMAVIAVDDQGVGMSDEELALIFQPFYTTKRHGLGLGLSICRTIIGAHGGTITGTRNPGGGMTFSASLPLEQSVTSITPTPPAALGVAGAPVTVTDCAAPGTHVVQFYEGERFLHRAVASFFSPAIQRGEPAVMIARRRTFEAVAAQCARDGGASADASRIVFVDVDEALRGFMAGLTPDPSRFEQTFANLVNTLGRRAEAGTTWIYGEMVDVLCRAGNHAAAVGLEELWNRALAGSRFSVLCGYGLQNFDEDLHANQFRAVCRQHSHVIPAEGYIDAPDGRSRLEQVAFLQQRARALAGALAHEPFLAVDPGAGTSTVYLVDDDESVRRSMVRLLVSMNLTVQAFESAEAFLAGVDRTAIGCLIVDVQLVGMSGSELQDRMVRAEWTMPVIAMSGAHNAQTEAETLRLGASAFLRKPFTTRALVSALERALGRSI